MHSESHHLSVKRRLIQAATPLALLEKPVQIRKWCRYVDECHCPMFATRQELYQYLQNQVLRDSRIDYLEFGVADGASLKDWTRLHQHPDSRFWGFDSFLGLPEDWSDFRPRGSFARGGRPPEIDDPRVQFQVGLFQETLPRFLRTYSPQERLVIHNDSDLYSATLFTLTQLDAIAPAGTVIIFDEFWDAGHEFRALIDYAAAYQRRFQIAVATQGFNQAAVILE